MLMRDSSGARKLRNRANGAVGGLAESSGPARVVIDSRP
jgi:hypothetical protein